MKNKNQQTSFYITLAIVFLLISFLSTNRYVIAQDCTFDADCLDNQYCVDGVCSSATTTITPTPTPDCSNTTVTTADCSATSTTTTTTTPTPTPSTCTDCDYCDPYSLAPPCKEDGDLCSLGSECCGGACSRGVCSSPTTPSMFRKIKGKSPTKKTIRASVTASTCNTNPGNLPSNYCARYRGNAQWLNCWRTNGSRSPVASLNAGGILSGCDLSNDQITQIKDDCTNIAIHSDKVRCVMDGIRNIIPRPSNACRHFARCFKKVWEEMGLSQEYTVRFLGSNGHAWNETSGTQGAGTSVIDVFNNIYYWCP